MKEFETVIIDKIKTYAIQAMQFKGNMAFSDFSSDIKTINACVFNLSQIGELVGRLAQ